MNEGFDLFVRFNNEENEARNKLECGGPIRFNSVQIWSGVQERAGKGRDKRDECRKEVSKRPQAVSFDPRK